MKRLKILFLIFFTLTLFVFFSCEKSYQNNNVEPSFELIASDFFIAFSKNTSADIVERRHTVFYSLKQDGTYHGIRQTGFRNNELK